jgi:hypothetical protein
LAVESAKGLKSLTPTRARVPKGDAQIDEFKARRETRRAKFEQAKSNISSARSLKLMLYHII